MAKSHWSVFCTWPLPAHLPANGSPRGKVMDVKLQQQGVFFLKLLKITSI